jgi:hypothetical protein
MWLDITISAALAILTIIMGYLGVHVTLHPTDSPKVQWRYKAGFILCAGLTVGIVIWQGVRNGMAQGVFVSRVSELTSKMQGLQSDISNARTDVTTESTRRQQAEKDLALIVQGVGKNTREGVVSDIKSSPLKVNIEPGQPEPPVLVGIRFTEAREASNDPALPYAEQVTIQTDKKIEPVALVIECSGPLSNGNASSGSGAYMMVSTGLVDAHPEWFLISWQSPAFMPETPIVAHLQSKDAIKVIGIHQIPWSQVRH